MGALPPGFAVTSNPGATIIRFALDRAREASLGSEGFELKAEPWLVTITAATDRGVLFGVGRLIREMFLDFHISYAAPLCTLCYLPGPLHIVSRPEYEMRMHQVGRRMHVRSS